METPKVMSHFLAHKTTKVDADVMAAQQAAARRQSIHRAARQALNKRAVQQRRDAITQASAKVEAEERSVLGASAPPEAKPWASVGDPAADQSAKISEWAASAQDEADAAAKDSKEVEKLAAKAAASVPAAFKMVEEAKAAAMKAHENEEQVRAVLDTTKKLVFDEAMEVVPDEIKVLKEAAHKKAKADAIKQGKKTKAEMLAKVPAAKKAAEEPYLKAMSSAGAMAAEYAKRGDTLSGQSATMQMNAQLTMGSANTYLGLGDMPLAQKLMQQSRMEMDLAVGLGGAAGDNYDKANSIMGTLGAYAAEGVSAAYHAEVMLNPDAPPPPAPLVR
jgi:hypothetical protein